MDDVEADLCLGLLLADDGEQVVEMPSIAVAYPLVIDVGVLAPLVQDDEVPRLLAQHLAKQGLVMRARSSIGSHDLPAEHVAEMVGQGVEAGIAVGPRLERAAAARQLV